MNTNHAIQKLEPIEGRKASRLPVEWRNPLKTFVDELGVDIYEQSYAKWSLAVSLSLFKQLGDRPDPSEWNRRNLLLVAPRSSGVSTLVRNALRIAGVKWHSPDLMEFATPSASGGLRNVAEMVYPLVRQYEGGDLPPGILGVIFLDNTEEWTATDPGSAARLENVQLATGRLAAGKPMTVPFGGRIAPTHSNQFLFIAAAQPENLAGVIGKRVGLHKTGFAPGTTALEDVKLSSLTTDEDLIKTGYSPAFLRAFEMRGWLHELNAEELVNACQLNGRVLDALARPFHQQGVTIEISEKALREAAEVSAQRLQGMKGLVNALNARLDPALFYVCESQRPIRRLMLQSLFQEPEFTFGQPLRQLMANHAPRRKTASSRVPAHLRGKFPPELLQRPARAASASNVRLANAEDLKAILK